MATIDGRIKRLTDKRFGIISSTDGTEYFFHQSACRSTRFDELREGQPATFERGEGPKGPRAEGSARREWSRGGMRMWRGVGPEYVLAGHNLPSCQALAAPAVPPYTARRPLQRSSA